MNSENGRKRLNVLLTRAIKSIQFYSSVRASDFKISDNESVNLLRKWIAFSESDVATDNIQFPFELKPKIDGNQLTFTAIHEKMNDAREIVTLHRVLEGRGWSVQYN